MDARLRAYYLQQLGVDVWVERPPYNEPAALEPMARHQQPPVLADIRSELTGEHTAATEAAPEPTPAPLAQPPPPKPDTASNAPSVEECHLILVRCAGFLLIADHPDEPEQEAWWRLVRDIFFALHGEAGAEESVTHFQWPPLKAAPFMKLDAAAVHQAFANLLAQHRQADTALCMVFAQDATGLLWQGQKDDHNGASVSVDFRLEDMLRSASYKRELWRQIKPFVKSHREH